MENELIGSLKYIIADNVTDLSGYAFQIFAVLVACSGELKETYKVIT